MSNIAQEHGSILMFASISLLLLLLIYFIYRRRNTNLTENKSNKQQSRQSFENIILIPEPLDYRLPPIHALPTIIEENSSTLSPSNSSNKLNPFSSSTNTSTSAVVTG